MPEARAVGLRRFRPTMFVANKLLFKGSFSLYLCQLVEFEFDEIKLLGDFHLSNLLVVPCSDFKNAF